MPRQLLFTAEKKEKFLELLRQGLSATEAAGNVGVSQRTVYDHRRSDPQFADEWARAYEIGGDILEAEAIKRAVDGWDEPVFGKVSPGIDGQIGVIRKKSDRLLEVALKGRRSIYKDNPRIDLHQQTVNVQIEDRTAGVLEMFKVLREVGASVVIEQEAVEAAPDDGIAHDRGGSRPALPSST